MHHAGTKGRYLVCQSEILRGGNTERGTYMLGGCDMDDILNFLGLMLLCSFMRKLKLQFLLVWFLCRVVVSLEC